MTAEQLKENIEDSLIRLKRDYALCYQGYDRPALKSLAHALRLWVDMRLQVDRYLTEHNPLAKFSSYSVQPLFNRTFRGRAYVLAGFPKRVLLRAQRPGPDAVAGSLPAAVTVSHLSIPMPPLEEGESVSFKFDLKYQLLGPHECAISCFIFVIDYPESRLGTSQDIAVLTQQAFDYQKVKFGSWLDGLAVRLASPASATAAVSCCDLSREDLIKRVANVLGGSHPQGGYVSPHDKDQAVGQLMEYKLLDIPVPYMALLKMAQDILQVFGSLP